MRRLSAIPMALLAVFSPALPVLAQAPPEMGAEILWGTTGLFSIPRAHLLPPGLGIVSANMSLGPSGPMPSFGGASLLTQFAPSDGFQAEMGAGWAPASTGFGRLSVAGKQALLTGDLSASGMVGLDLSRTGVASVAPGVMLGLPITWTHFMASARGVSMTAFPFWAPRFDGAASPLGLGLGMALRVADRMALLGEANTTVGAGGMSLQATTFGVRTPVSQSVIGDVYVRYSPQAPAPVTLGLVGSMLF